MEALLACLAGLIFSAAIYLMLSGNLVRFVFGLVLISNAVNLILFSSGRLDHFRPPLIGPGQSELTHPVSNALPQALILTAIVIGFAMVTFLLVLLYRTGLQTGTLNSGEGPFLREEAGSLTPESFVGSYPLRDDEADRI